MCPFPSNRKLGLSLVELLIAASILGLVAVMMGSLLSGTIQSLQTMYYTSQRETLKAKIRIQTDCTVTKNKMGPYTSTVKLYNRNGDLLFKGGKDGDWIIHNGRYNINTGVLSIQVELSGKQDTEYGKKKELFSMVPFAC